MIKSVKGKSFILFICLALVLVSLAACSKKDDNASSGDKTTPPASSTDTSKTDDQKKDDPPAEESKKIDFGGASIKMAANGDYLKPDPSTEIGARAAEALKAAEEKYNVKVEFLALTNEEMNDKMKASILNGAPVADMWYMGSPAVVPTLAKQGFFIPLEDMLPSVAQEKQLNMELLSKVTGVDGKTYGIGDGKVDSIGVFYNREMFKNAGLPDPHTWIETKEWTWDKFREVAKMMTKDTNGDGTNDEWGVATYVGDWVWMAILAYGGNIYDKDTGKQLLDDPKAQAAMDFVYKVVNEDKVMAVTDWGFMDAMGKGNIAMSPSFSWFGGSLKATLGENYGFLPMPLGPGQSDYINPARQTNLFFMAKGAIDPAATLQVWKEMQVGSYDENVRNYNEAQYAHEDDIQVATDLLDKTNYDFFAGLHGGIIDQIGNAIAKGEVTPAQAAQQYGPKLQDKFTIGSH